MKLEDVKVGMKVRLLGKHGVSKNYDNIEDWYKDWRYNDSVEQIKEQGFGFVVGIHEDSMILVAEDIGIDGWCFLPSDLEPYESIDKLDKTKHVFLMRWM